MFRTREEVTPEENRRRALERMADPASGASENEQRMARAKLDKMGPRPAYSTSEPAGGFRTSNQGTERTAWDWNRFYGFGGNKDAGGFNDASREWSDPEFWRRKTQEANEQAARSARAANDARSRYYGPPPPNPDLERENRAREVFAEVKAAMQDFWGFKMKDHRQGKYSIVSGDGLRTIVFEVHDGFIAEARHMDRRVVGSTKTGVPANEVAKTVIDMMRLP